MKKKRWQQWLAFLLASTMLVSTEGTVLAQSQGTIKLTSQEEDRTKDPEQTEESEKDRDIVLPASVEGWSDGYETVTTQEEADALRDQDGEKNLLIAAENCTLSGLAYAEIATTGTTKLELSNVKTDVLTVDQAQDVRLSGSEIEQLRVITDEGQTVSVKLDDETKIPDIVLEGTGTVKIEGSGSLGMVRLAGVLAGLTVRATCSVLNESGSEVPLVTPDGDEKKLASGQQEELVLSSYLITFMADGEVYETTTAKPGDTIRFPEQNPEKEGKIFTCWYVDEDFTETCSQFAVAEGETTLYARFVDAADAVTVTFDTMGGTQLEPMLFAKGETLLSRSVNEICTEKEGYTFGGWCTDEECTTAFAYTDPIQDSMTLYAFFVSNEVQEVEKDGTSVEISDLDWQGIIPLRTDEEMSLEEVQANVSLEPASGGEEPVLDIKETEDGFSISGSYYEKDGETGFEPGASFSILVSGGVHFADYPDGTDTAVVTIQKERVEIVGFSEDITYVLWDDVMDYTPVKAAQEEEEETETETGEETEDTEAAEEAEITEAAEDTKAGEEDTEASDETGTENVADPDGADIQEIEGEAYTPGTLLVKNTTEYKEGDIVAFYDGEIGRDEKNIDAYTEGSFDGYVLFAQILKVEDTADGTCLTFGYASPEDYLTDLDVNVTDDVDLEQQLSDEDLEVLTSRLSDQIEGNEELKAQMLVSVMSAPETQDMLDDLYGEGTYALAGMTASLKPSRPSVSLSVSGSDVTASISISATVTISKDGEVLMTVEPTLSFSQSLGVKTEVKAGKVWINMAVTVRSTTKIALTISATTGGDVSVFTEAKESLEEIVKPEGISEDNYASYDESVSDLMETMSSIVATSLEYNDLFDILLLNLRFSFYGIVTVGFEVHLVGQVGVLATFGVEIIAKSGETIGFEYNFLKFKGSSYTKKLESSVTNNIYLIGKVGVRVGLRLKLSVTICAIASASITGNLYAYAELTGIFFMTTNLLSGASTNLGALHFEVGIDVEVFLTLQVKLIFKTIGKSWKVYSGRWPLWSTSVSSKMSYMDGDELDKLWETSIENADHKASFGFQTVPMKTWDLMKGSCQTNQLLFTGSSGVSLKIKNLVVNGESVPEGDERYGLFRVGDASKGQNPGYIYLDEDVASEYVCEEAELDVELTYENNSSSALVKKQVQTFHLKKKCSMATTTHNVKVVLNDWCARSWGLQTAAWDNETVYETSFTTTHILGSVFDRTATGTLDINAVISAAQGKYPEIAQYTCTWRDPSLAENTIVQYSTPQVSSFCYMTPENGVVRYDVRAKTEAYDVTYYLYVRRFEGNEDSVRYHINLQGKEAEDTYTFTVVPRKGNDSLTFTEEGENTYLLTAHRAQFDESEQPLMMSVNGEEATKTGFSITGREYAQDIYFDITIDRPTLGIQLGEGVSGYKLTDPGIQTEDGIKAGTKVELEVEFAEGYGGLEATSENENVSLKVDGNKVSFIMPGQDVAITLRAYRLHSITYEYQFAGYGTYETAYFAENQETSRAEDPSIEGLTFRGWYTSADGTGEPYTFGEKLLTDVTLYAAWTCDVTVYFAPAKGKAAYLTETEEGTKENLLFEDDETEYYSFTFSTLRAGEKLPDIQIPEYEGYQFMGWYDNAACEGDALNLETYVLSGGMAMYAKWAKMVDVNYDRNDGTAELYAETTGFAGYPLTIVPDAPERQYYTFKGWYKNRAATDAFDVEKDTVEGSMTLYAGWTANTYQITYDLAGGTETQNPSTYTTEDAFTLAAPTREGYTFAGWTGTDLEEAATEVSVAAGNGGDRTYTATWTVITYNITYERAYQNSENPESYNIESDEIVLAVPTRDKYKFEGWTGTELTEPTLEVHIPTGSMGDRTYRGTWSTEDPILEILERVRVLADDNPYQNDLSALMTEEDQSDTGVEINYETLQENLTKAVKEHLKDLIAKDEKIQAYSDRIELTVSFNKETTDLNSDTQKQKYGFEITASYTDDNDQKTTGEAFDYPAELKKLTPEVTGWPTASHLTYGQTVDESTLTGGTAQYEGTKIEGTFAWNEEEQSRVPFGRNNGTEDSSYKVTFTPGQTDCFAIVEGSVGVLTQVGVAVTAVADSRDYIPGNTKATGTSGLVYVDTDGKPTTEACEVSGLLTGGTWFFADDNAEKDKTVTFGGYSLDPDKNTDTLYQNNVYALVGADTVTCQADINKVTQDNANLVITAPSTEKASYTYGEKLKNILLTGGTVKYQSSTDNITLEGSWSWADSTQLESKPAAGTSSYGVIFTPDEKYGNGYGTFTETVTVTVDKKQITVPTIADRSYDGSAQAATVPSGEYKVTENNEYTKVGEYTVKLTLTDPDNTQWVKPAGDAADKVTISDAEATTKYQILPAETTADTSKVSSIQLLYGQKLTSDASDKTEEVNGVENMTTQLTAKGRVSGATVTSSTGASAAEGTWSWVLTGDGNVTLEDGTTAAQPLAASDTIYKVKAKFTPSDANLKSCEAYLPVKVGKATPYTGSVTLTSDIYLKSGVTNTENLSTAPIVATGNPKNPYTGEEITGTWAWSDASTIPTASASYTADFTPENTTNYNSSGAASCALRINTIEIEAEISLTYGSETNSSVATTGDRFTWSDTYSAYVLKLSCVISPGYTAAVGGAAVNSSASSVAVTRGHAIGHARIEAYTSGTVGAYEVKATNLFISYGATETVTGEVNSRNNVRIELLCGRNWMDDLASMSISLVLGTSTTGNSISLSSLMESSALEAPDSMAMPEEETSVISQETEEDQTQNTQEEQNPADNESTPEPSGDTGQTTAPTEPETTDQPQTETTTPTDGTDQTETATRTEGTDQTETAAQTEGTDQTETTTPAKGDAQTEMITQTEEVARTGKEETAVTPAQAEASEPEKQELSSEDTKGVSP